MAFSLIDLLTCLLTPGVNFLIIFKRRYIHFWNTQEVEKIKSEIAFLYSCTQRRETPRVIYKNLVSWQEIKSLTWEITFFKNFWFLLDYFLMKIISSNYSLVMQYVSELLQPMVNYCSNKLKEISFFHSSYCFLPPIDLIETRAFSIFEHVLSRISNVMNIMNWTAISISTKALAFSKPVFSLQTQTFFW